MQLGLTPQGRLRLDPDSGGQDRPELARLRKAFERDWREGVFELAAHKPDASGEPALRFWQSIAESHLASICHLSEGDNTAAPPPPDDSTLAEWALGAPPMVGGEYLSPGAILGVWEALSAWANEAAQAGGGFSAFLQARAPRWRQVGRVFFHLAENKSNPALPFAFMASYTTGLGGKGETKHLGLGKALEQYAGEKNRQALIKLLSPVHEAGQRCPWVKEMVDTGAVYRPAAWPSDQAYRLLLSVPELEASGLAVRLPDWWRQRPRPRVNVTIGGGKPSGFGVEAMLDFKAEVALGDAVLGPGEVEELLAGAGGLVLFKGQWVEVDKERLREAIQQWKSVERQAKDGAVGFIEGMRMLAGAPRDMKDGEDETAKESREWAFVEAGPALRSILERLRDPARLAPIGADGGLRATLRPYQAQGAAWLRFLAELGLGACLADDMGLGKTLQVLALLQALRRGRGAEPGLPSLLVVPASLLGNWRAEAERFAPDLKLLFLHPGETEKAELASVAASPQKGLRGVDLAVTTYAMAARQDWLAKARWNLLILDEAQAIKNPGTAQTKSVKRISARARIALSGTPVENRLGDLWSIFDFLNPGLLGGPRAFSRFVGRLENGAEASYGPLRRLVSPYILRRLKTDKKVIADLPDKTETFAYCRLTPAQAKLYQSVVEGMKATLDAAEGIQRRGLVLQSIMRLKQACNHPSQLTGEGGYDPAASGKFERVAEICGELAERQERVLVFSQFREIIDPLAAHLERVFGRPGLVLHGGTGVKSRAALVAEFQREDGPPFMILSLKAGGTGLNLTAASHVIHFDRWWNPAVESQATDRAFRIGQRRNVLVHKLVVRGTIEERIDVMIEEKRQLAAEMFSGEGEINITEMPDAALLDLVRLDLARAAG